MQIADVIDYQDCIPTLLEWARREWPPRSPGETAEARRTRLVGELQRGQFPFCLVALEGETPIGFVSVIHYILGGQVELQHWVDMLYVLPEQRQRGFGSQLLREAERRAAALGVQKLYVFTNRLAWYRQQGWTYTDQTAAESAVLQKRVG